MNSENSTSLNPSASSAPQKKNLLLEILVTIIVPSLILSKLSGPERLGPTNSIWVAFAFPVAWGLYWLFRTRKIELMPILGVVSVALTGGLGLVQADGFWFAVKEAAIPSILGIAVVSTTFRTKPLIHVFLLNENVMDLQRLNQALHERNSKEHFDALLRRANLLLGCTFFLSAVLNFGLAIFVLKSAPGTTEFAAELGKMNALSWPVIVLPSMLAMAGLIFWLATHIQKFTGISFQDLLKQS